MPSARAARAVPADRRAMFSSGSTGRHRPQRSEIAGGRPRRAWRRAGLALLLATAILFLLLLMFPLPQSILSPAMERSSSWLLADGKGRGRIGHAARKLVGTELQISLAAHVYRSQRLPSGLSDAQRIAARLGAVKALMIDQTELPHWPVSAPAALAG